jgi:hypothetical protein
MTKLCQGSCISNSRGELYCSTERYRDHLELRLLSYRNYKCSKYPFLHFLRAVKVIKEILYEDFYIRLHKKAKRLAKKELERNRANELD